jgi:predicted TIM-barrel fold metal-dependent hydrolase
MPPSMQTMESSPEFMIAQMNHAGVDVGIVQNMPIYGFLNEFTAAAAAKYPSRFVGLAAIDELHANKPAELARLRSYVTELGLSGLYYHLRGFFYDSYRTNFDDPRYEEFWALVEELSIPVFWDPKGVPTNTPENQAKQYALIDKWAERHTGVTSVITHGLHPSLVDHMPDSLSQLLSKPNVLLELLYAIDWGGVYDYPFAEVRPQIKELYRRLGASRLVWGSDMPAVERVCTYSQSLEYLRKYCDFIPSSDMDLILGGNLASVFGLARAR